MWRLSARWISSESYPYSEITSPTYRLRGVPCLHASGDSEEATTAETGNEAPSMPLRELLTTRATMLSARLMLSGDSKFPSWDVFNGCHAKIYAGVLRSAAGAQSRRGEWASVTVVPTNSSRGVSRGFTPRVRVTSCWRSRAKTFISLASVSGFRQ